MQKDGRSLFDLPIKKYSKMRSYSEREILYAVENSDVTVIIAETGTGKTTRNLFALFRNPAVPDPSRLYFGEADSSEPASPYCMYIPVPAC
jgi:hypothetical protein